jgi:hypothetical protein
MLDSNNAGHCFGHGSVAALYADLIAIDAANPGKAIEQLKAAITAFAPENYLDALRELLADGARLRMAEAQAQRNAQFRAVMGSPSPPGAGTEPRPPLPLPPMPPPQAARGASGGVWRPAIPRWMVLIGRDTGPRSGRWASPR